MLVIEEFFLVNNVLREYDRNAATKKLNTSTIQQKC